MGLSIPSGWKPFLRKVVHPAALIPLILLVFDYFTNRLTVNPIQAATQRTGLTGLILLTVMLAFTPFATITGDPYWRSFRKPVGLYAALYAGIHVFIFTVLDFNLNWSLLKGQLTEKPFIWFGLAGLLILAALALTSLRILKKRMGKYWKKLHQMVYLAGLIIVVHDLLSQKGNALLVRGNLLQPLVIGGIIIFLLVLRIPVIKRWIAGKR